jgi:hypothetical protein
MRARLMLGGLAAAGVSVAHWLAYRVVTPHEHLREELLERTGHRYSNILFALAFGVFAAVVAGAVAARVSAGRKRLLRPSFGKIARRLSVWQMGGWIALELTERLVVAHHHSSIFTEPVLWIGLGVQLLVAVVSALLFVVLDRALGRIIELVRGLPDPPRARRSWPIVQAAPVRTARLGGAWRSRGPPHPAAV